MLRSLPKEVRSSKNDETFGHVTRFFWNFTVDVKSCLEKQESPGAQEEGHKESLGVQQDSRIGLGGAQECRRRAQEEHSRTAQEHSRRAGSSRKVWPRSTAGRLRSTGEPRSRAGRPRSTARKPRRAAGEPRRRELGAQQPRSTVGEPRRGTAGEPRSTAGELRSKARMDGFWITTGQVLRLGASKAKLDASDGTHQVA